MRKSLWAYVVAILGTLLSALNLAATHFEMPFLDAVFHISSDARHDMDRIVANLALSIVAMLASSLFGMFLIIADSKDQVAEDHRNLKATLGQLPQTRIFGSFLSSDEALAYLTRRLPEALVLHNTRLIGTPAPRDTGKARERYERAYASALKEARAYDIVSPAWEARSRMLREAAGSTYNYRVLEGHLPPFLNFIVLQYRDSTSEVLFGWTTSEDSGYGHSGFRTTEQRVIEFFIQWHQELMQAGSAPNEAAHVVLP